MKQDPLISIIVPCYNQASYLPETINSIRAQTYSNWECIIVNDGSTDNTGNIAKEYCLCDNKRLKYLYIENSGPSSARNAGINISSGEFILPLDSDDIIEVTYIKKAIQRFINYPDTKLVYCKAALFGDIVKNWELEEYNYEKFLFSNMIFCSAIFKRIDFDKTMGYNANMVHGLEDWDFWLSLINENDIVYQIPEILFYYRISKESRHRNIPPETFSSIERQIVINHKEKYERYLPEIISNNSLVEQQKETINSLNNEILKIQDSRAYRTGKFLVRPFSKAKTATIFILKKNILDLFRISRFYM